MRSALPESCTWCPRKCGANRAAGQKGLCGADDALRIARAALHFWEEPPISGQAGSGTIFFSYCPLRCAYCQNHSIALGDAGADVSFDRLVDIMFEQKQRGALNLNMVTPTHYGPIIADAVRVARSKGLDLLRGTPQATRRSMPSRGLMALSISSLLISNMLTLRWRRRFPARPTIRRSRLLP